MTNPGAFITRLQVGLAAVLLAHAAFGAEIVVTTPEEIANAAAEAQPGDTLVMPDGTWHDANILFSAQGTAANPITLRAATLGGVHLTGSSRLRLSGSHLVVQGLVFTNTYTGPADEIIRFEDPATFPANNSRVIHCAFIAYNPVDPAIDTKWIALYGISNRVEFCYFRGKNNSGPTLAVWVDARPNTPNYHVIARNHFAMRPALGANGGETIRIGTSDVSLNLSRTTVEENLFEQCNGDVEIVSSKSLENVFRHNTFIECEGSLCLRHGNGSVVEGNYFFGNGKPLTGGVRICGEDHRVFNNYFFGLTGTSSRAPLALMQGLTNSPLNGYFQVKRAEVAFNTFVQCTTPLVIGLPGTLSGSADVTTLPPIDCAFANNIVLQATGKIVDQRITPVELAWENNLLFGGTLGIATNQGTWRINPQLATDGTLWRPIAGSPAIGAASTSYAYVINDIEGHPRLGSRDIGCDQGSADSTHFPPLGSTNVGPLWMRVDGAAVWWNRPGDITYGTPLSAVQLAAAANVPGTFTYTPLAGTILKAGSNQVLTVVFSPQDAADFQSVTQQVTINVLKAVPAVSWVTPAAITYGTPLGAAQLNATSSTPGSIVYHPPTGTVLASGPGHTLTATFTPSDTSNYLSTTKSVLLTVSKATPLVTWSEPAPIEYGIALDGGQLRATSNIPGQFVYSPPAGTVLDVGAGQRLSVVFTPADSGNYSVVTGQVRISVTLNGKLFPRLTWSDPAPLLHGTPLGSVQLNASADVAGTFTYHPPAGTVLAPGNGQLLTVRFTPADQLSYTSVTASVTIDVAAASSNATLRVAYVIPSNRTAQKNSIKNLHGLILSYQTWFRDQMTRNGFGAKTFTIETEPDGVTPLVHVLTLPRDDAWLRGGINGERVVSAAREAGLTIGAPGQIWWLAADTHLQLPDGWITGAFEAGKHLPAEPLNSGWVVSSGAGLALSALQFQTNALPYHGQIIPELGPYPLVQSISFPWFEGTTLSDVSSSAIGLTLRNLAFAFGLQADYRNDENFNGSLLGFGFRGLRGALYPDLFPYNYCALPYASALLLDASAIFNPGRPAVDNQAPIARLLTSGRQQTVNGLVTLTFEVSDDRALRGALLAWGSDTEFTVIDEMALSGTFASSSFTVPHFHAEQTNRYQLRVFDEQGHMEVAETAVVPAASINHSPRPFVRVLPVTAGPGEDLLLDASATFDPEHGLNLLEFEWDLDGDGWFDTFPTTDPFLVHRYDTLGSRLVRVRVTDPAGDTAVSAPVAILTRLCPAEISPASRLHGFSGSTGSVYVTVSPQCRWIAVNTNDWIQLLTTDEIIGSGRVEYVVSPNTTFATREGTLWLADQLFVVRQRPLECSFSVSPSSRFQGFGSATNTFRVATRAECSWEIDNTNSWITILSGATGFGTGTVTYAVTANRVPHPRTGVLRIADRVFTLTQWGTNCSVALGSTNQLHGEGSETGSVSVATSSACTWTVVNTNSWVSLLSSNATGFTYSLEPNLGSTPRIAVLVIGSQEYTIIQRACTFTLGAVGRAHTHLAETGSVDITTSAICAWSIQNPADWITLLSGNIGAGPGTVGYRLTTNPTSDPRQATLTIAGQPFTISQSGKPCAYVLSSTNFQISHTAQTRTISVSAEPGCNWVADHSVPWISILQGSSGSGNGIVQFRADLNTGPARSGIITVAGQQVAVSQASGIRLVTAGNISVASGNTNCVPVTLAALGGETNLSFSLCYDTNLLAFTSARIVSGAPTATALALSTNQASLGRVGVSVSTTGGRSFTNGAVLNLAICLRALPVFGKPLTPLTICDTPVTRRLVGTAGTGLPASFLDGTAQIIGFCSLPESLNAPQLTWTVDEFPWTCQTNTSHDGDGAVVSAAIDDDEDSNLQTTLTGPGRLSFWWKVSSEPSNDRLRFYLDGSEQFRISGEVDWEWRTINIPSGQHTARWRYSKNSSTRRGADRGWVDEVVFEGAPPSITLQPVSLDTDAGSTSVFTVAAAGQPPLTYQWLLDGHTLSDGGRIRGARTTSLTISNTTLADAGTYSVVVGNAAGNVTSSGADLRIASIVSLAAALDTPGTTWSTVGTPAWVGQDVVSHDGVDAARCGAIAHGGSGSMETIMSGPGTVRFWWKVSSETNNDRMVFYVNGTERARISGETDWQERTLTIGSGTQTLRWTYVKNSALSAGLDRAWVDQVEFQPAPIAITAQPTDVAVEQGNMVVLSVAANGGAPIFHQWRKDGAALTDSSAIRGSTTATLTLSNTVPEQSGRYTVVLSNAAGSVISAEALVTISRVMPLNEALDAPGLVFTTSGTPPWTGSGSETHDGIDAARSGRVGDGLTTSFRTTVTGPGTISFWWKVSSEEEEDELRFYINGSEREQISGEVDWTWRSYALGSGTQTLEWRYRKNSDTAAGQDRAWVDQVHYVRSGLPSPPVIAIHPMSRTAVAPANLAFSAIAAGSTPLQYQWYFNGVPVENGAPYSGATTTNLVLTGANAAAAGAYFVVVTNSAGAATSSLATLDIIAAPVITLQPSSRQVTAGATIDLSVRAIGMSPLAYRWQFKGTNLVNSGNVSGATSTNLRITAVSSAQAGNYTVVVSNPAGSATSAVATVSVTTPPSITAQPANRTVLAGGSVQFAVQANGSAPLSYHWRLNGGAIKDGNGFNGADTSTLLVENVEPTHAGQYSVIVSNSAGTVTSTNAALTVLTLPVIAGHPTSQIVPEGATVRLTVTASGAGPFTYRWRKDGTPLTNAPGVNGVTSAALTLSNAQPAQSGAYDVIVANSAGPVTSSSAQLTVVPAMTLAESVNAPYLDWRTGGSATWVVQSNITHDAEGAAASGAIGNSSTSWIETTVTGPGTVQFWWRVSSETNGDFASFRVEGAEWAQLSGETDWQQLRFPIPSGNIVLRWIYSKNGAAIGGLDRAWLDEFDFVPVVGPQLPMIVEQPQSRDVAPGTTVTFNARAVGTAPLSYQWRFNGEPLSDSQEVLGANSPTLTVFNVQETRAGLYDLVVRNSYSLDISEQVYLNVFPVIPLAKALDTEPLNLNWIAGGNSPWRGQADDTADRLDAAQSGALGARQTNWIETTMLGPGAVSFWWKVSSQTNRDRLAFYMDGVERATISGVKDWHRQVFPITGTSAKLRWSYMKDGSTNSNLDRGWLDLVQFEPIAAVITNYGRITNIVDQGTTIRLSVDPSGTSPFSFQWRLNGTNLLEGGNLIGAQSSRRLIVTNSQPQQSGNYTVVVANQAGFVTSSNFIVRIVPGLPLAPALNRNLVWETGGFAWWLGTDTISYDDGMSARTGSMEDDASTWLRTQVVGPGTVSFRWRASTEPNRDILHFSVDGSRLAQISGTVAWQLRTFNVGPGQHELQWEYTKDADNSDDFDTVWLDEVNFTYTGPVITTHPVAQRTLDAGTTLSLSTSVNSPTMVRYQWLFNGAPLANNGNIAGATNNTLTVSGIQLSQAGVYSVLVSNAVGWAMSSNSSVTVIPTYPLSEALDTTGLTWSAGTPPWLGQPTVTHDGVDAARTPALNHSQSSSMETVVTGPGTVSFWWRVSSQPNNDVLTFAIDGTEQARISGEVSWARRVFNVSSGTHTLRWRYAKNSSGTAGQDRGWVDQVEFGELPPIITTQPVSLVVGAGTTAGFAVSATSGTPLTYQWLWNGSPLANGAGISGATSATLSIANVQAARTGSYSVVVSNRAGATLSASATLGLLSSFALEEALDAPGLSFTTGGTGPAWRGQNAVTHDGTDAAVSGSPMRDSTYTWVKTTVAGPGTLSFWWKVSSEEDHDYFRFMLNAVDQLRIHGETEWQQVTFPIPAGTHELQWRYSRSPSDVGGSDTAWLDQVSYVRAGDVEPPRILLQPGSIAVEAGESATFNVGASGAEPLHYQWFFQSTNLLTDSPTIRGAASAELTLMEVLPTDAGVYSVRITNAGGAVISTAARLTVIPAIALDEALDIPGEMVSTTSDFPWTGQNTITRDGFDAARSGQVDDGQSSALYLWVDGPGSVAFWWRVSSETNADVLTFTINGQTRAQISGETAWDLQSVVLPPGAQLLEWTYTKDGSGSAGADRAWLDEVELNLADLTPAPEPEVPTSAVPARIAALGTRVLLSWQGHANQVYKVFYKDSLHDPEWKELNHTEVLPLWKPSPANGSSLPSTVAMTAEDVLPGQMRFYRVMAYHASSELGSN